MKTVEIPSGLKDMTGREAQKKYLLQRKLEEIFLRSGYQFVMTPDIEYYQTYVKAFQTVNEEEMYKFFDQDGQILTLREDMTVPIARVVASKLKDVQPPFRFCYTQNVYKVRQTFAGKRNEVTDCGIELIGADEKSDPEVLVTALEVMESLGAKQYTLEIGNSNFFKYACMDAGISDEQMSRLAQYVDQKFMVDLQEYLEELKVNEEIMQFFMKLPLLSGKKEILLEAEKMCFTDRLAKEVEKLIALHDFLSKAGYEEVVSFDLGKVPHLNYYTGIIFEGYIQGVGSAVLSGGRYDALLQKFGRDLPACGFGVKIDPIVEAVELEIPSVTKLYYPSSLLAEALQKAKQLREKENVELVLDESRSALEVVR